MRDKRAQMWWRRMWTAQSLGDDTHVVAMDPLERMTARTPQCCVGLVSVGCLAHRQGCG